MKRIQLPHIFPAIICIALFAGCTTPQYNYRAESKQISFPEIGAIVTANIGDEMLRQGVYTEADAIKLNSEIKIGMLGAYTLNPGFYDKTGEDRSNEFYYPSPGLKGGSVKKAALSDPWQSVVFSKDGKKIGVITIFNVAVKSPVSGVSKIKRPALAENSFQQTLIYSGKVGNKVNLGYREFSNNAARPAFNNDVEYDLTESDIVGYKGARLKIIEADNRSITYEVLENFVPSEM